MLQYEKKSEGNDKMKKVALVTGGAKGIGSAIVKRLICDGYKVAFTYNSSKEKALKLCVDLGTDCKAYRLDITDSNAVNFVIEDIEKGFGEIAILVNNAGVAEQTLFTDITDEMWHRMLNTNISGAFYCCRAVLKYMINRKSGKIINISSIWGETGGSCEVHYSASKAGLIGMTKALAKEVGLSGITVNSVSPGVILTDMTSHFDEETMNALKEETPLNRIGTPEDVAGAVAFLCSKDADFITGQNLSVNGGMNI
jgi:3-oxoacyl-[acyl-carrier protein] reductase